VAILWDYAVLGDAEKNAIAAERAYLGLSYDYFTSVDPTLVVGRFVAKLPDLPTWACLDCSPEWREMHLLTGAEWRLHESMIAAVEAIEFEKAAALRNEERRLQAAHVPRYERLLRDLIPSNGLGRQGT
jgi:hypothetical protein